jgi:hypothetical protein
MPRVVKFCNSATGRSPVGEFANRVINAGKCFWSHACMPATLPFLDGTVESIGTGAHFLGLAIRSRHRRLTVYFCYRDLRHNTALFRPTRFPRRRSGGRVAVRATLKLPYSSTIMRSDDQLATLRSGGSRCRAGNRKFRNPARCTISGCTTGSGKPAADTLQNFAAASAMRGQPARIHRAKPWG